MSRKTNQLDLNTKAKDYLKGIGVYNHGGKVGDLVIWCRYVGTKCVQAGPTEESVTPIYAETFLAYIADLVTAKE